MSKKKSVTTMTLKDFHGGSIPSDLPLPSAPGVSSRPTLSPPSQPSISSRSLRHVAPPQPSISPLPSRLIGRHFDEDERTPFDAPAQRNPPLPSGAWASRKDQSDRATCPSNPVPTVWSPSKVAQASAVEKVISGRWLSNSKSDPPVSNSVDLVKPKSAPPVSNSVDSVKANKSDSPSPLISDSSFKSSTNLSEPIKPSSDIWAPPLSDPSAETNPLIRAHGCGFERPVARSGVIGENRVSKTQERKSSLEQFRPFGKNDNSWGERPRSVGARSAVDLEGREIGRPASHEGRPKLRLLPRSGKVGAGGSGEGRMVISGEGGGGGGGGEEGRAQIGGGGGGGGGGESGKRQSVFGGARPRELVLKDRGVDQVPQEPEKILPSSRPSSATSSELNQTKPNEKRFDNSNPQRNTRNPNPNSPQSYRPHEAQWTNRRAPHQHVSSRPEPDSWRKPAPPAKQEAPRVSKGASALELAQAFSKPGNEIPVRRGENPALFSRLLGGERAPHQHINGY